MLSEVLANEFFFHHGCFANQSDQRNAVMLWNPSDSGVNMSLQKVKHWSSVGDVLNCKRVTSPFSGALNLRNSMFFAQAVSKTGYLHQVFTGSSEPSGNVFDVVNGSETYEVPVVVPPGEGFVWYPDTTAQHNFCVHVEFRETPI